jgi:hypothetical protein
VTARKKNGSVVSPEDFIRTWQRGDSVSAVAKALGMGRQVAASRAVLYRRKGIPLKHMQRGAPQLDVEALTKLANDEAKKGK